MPKQTALDHAILEAALVGLQHQKSEIDTKVAEIRRMLRSQPADGTASSSTVRPVAPKRRRMSAAARKRIGEATRKRWAAYRAKNSTGTKARAKKSGIK
jgi:hypothetical protein